MCWGEAMSQMGQTRLSKVDLYDRVGASGVPHITDQVPTLPRVVCLVPLTAVRIMQQGACTAVSSASKISGTCLNAGAPFGSRRVSGVEENSSALRISHTFGSLHR